MDGGEGLVENGQQCHHCVRRQQGGGSVMIWPGFIGVEVLGLIRVSKHIEINYAVNCQLLESALFPLLGDVPLLEGCKLMFSMIMPRLIQKRKLRYFFHP